MTAIPFGAALYLVARIRSRSAQHKSGLLVLLAGAAGVLIVGIAINGSLAGLGLSVSVLAASGLMLLSRKRKIPVWSLVPLGLLTLAAVLVIFSKPLGNNLTAADAGNIAVSRQTSFANTLSAAADYFPIGSGVGTFNVIYPMYEDPVSLTTTYVNHAHSDLLEILLETGLPGVILLGLFLFWWGRRTIAIWRSEEVDQFARAATIATAAIMAHSLVDYPLRTAAISAIFAACCALMAEPRGVVRQRDGDRTGSGRHLSAD
jgi:O-antigen ligase